MERYTFQIKKNQKVYLPTGVGAILIEQHMQILATVWNQIIQ